MFGRTLVTVSSVRNDPHLQAFQRGFPTCKASPGFSEDFSLDRINLLLLAVPASSLWRRTLDGE